MRSARLLAVSRQQTWRYVSLLCLDAILVVKVIARFVCLVTGQLCGMLRPGGNENRKGGEEIANVWCVLHVIKCLFMSGVPSPTDSQFYFRIRRNHRKICAGCSVYISKTLRPLCRVRLHFIRRNHHLAWKGLTSDRREFSNRVSACYGRPPLVG